MQLLVLNRDGLINHFRVGGVTELSQWQPVSGAADQLARLNQAGFNIVIATNQPAIGSGEMELDQLEAIHTKLNELVENRGATIAGIFYCPHTPDDNCFCRKPKTGLIDAIELEFGVPADEIVFVTSQKDDVILAETVGAQAIFVTPVLAEGVDGNTSTLENDAIIARFNLLSDACDYILRHF
ncbi:D-glycero-beta-D-manno-heptose 1,7-bisphosphate 7-phosphatase [Sessilibacter sp. MAH1]